MEQLDINTNKFVIVTFDLRELLGYVYPVMIRNLDVSALDHDVHVTSLVRTAFDSEIPAGSPSGKPVRRRPGQCAAPPPLTAGGGWECLPTPDTKTLTLVRPPVTPRHGKAQNFHRMDTVG
ncbi:hypothetical protein [Micromonospora sp. NBC_01412]|uniref:hypothetical protein n=1 Tax=Micromonospora sp. NBC_01412 TaxID=2903590 RepID=UPI0032515D93